MLANEPLISIVIGAFNVEKYLKTTVQSVLNQTYRNFELIIVDDDSKDKTPELAATFAREDSRVRLIQLEKNSGLPAVPRNRGIVESRGEFIAFLDHDDLWTRWKLEDQVNAMLRYPELVMVYSMFWKFYRVNVLSSLFGLVPPKGYALNRTELECANPIACSSVLARLDLVKELGGFDEDPELKAVEDYDFWLRISEHGAIGFIPRIHVFYRIHSNSTYNEEACYQRARYLFKKRKISQDAFSMSKENYLNRVFRGFKCLKALAAIIFAETISRRVGSIVPVHFHRSAKYS